MDSQHEHRQPAASAPSPRLTAKRLTQLDLDGGPPSPEQLRRGRLVETTMAAAMALTAVALILLARSLPLPTHPETTPWAQFILAVLAAGAVLCALAFASAARDYRALPVAKAAHCEGILAEIGGPYSAYVERLDVAGRVLTQRELELTHRHLAKHDIKNARALLASYPEDQ